MASESPGADARKLAEQILDAAAQRGASDVHVEPTANGYELRYRLDGLLERVEHFDAATGRSVVTRLMVLAQLLTYRLDVPQEGRISIRLPKSERPLELRLAIMPTMHGLRAVVRMPAELTQPRTLDQLQLADHVMRGLRQFAAADSGMLLLTGPAGSGKTTTIYALLDHIAERSPGLSIISLEDPVERDLPKVTQIQVQPFGELTYERALRSILRQDPQVLMLGEIRDRATASLAVQATLSGHRLIATFHAGTPGGAIARLLEMGIEPYQITSALFAVVAQRLLRASDGRGGYAGRRPVAEIALVDEALCQAVLDGADARSLDEQLSARPDYTRLRTAAGTLIDQGLTDLAEVERILGPADA